MAETSPAPALGPDDSAKRRLEHVAEVSKQARASWFLMLGFLAFAGVTLLGVEDADFFRYGASTDLPVLNIEIPTRSFFWVAPLLITAFFVHLHLYLLKLWNAIALLPAQVEGQDIDACVFPWLVTDWALTRRRLRRGRPLSILNDLIVLTLVWVGPLAILGLFWYRVIPIRDKPLIACSGTCFCFVATVVACTLVSARSRLTRPSPSWSDPRGWPAMRRLFAFWWPVAFFVLTAGILFLVSLDRVEYGRVLPIASANLRGAELSVRPDDWKPHAVARDEFLDQYRRRRGLPAYSEWTTLQRDAFQEMWRSHRLQSLSKIKSPTLAGRDLRHADLSGAFLPAIRGLRLNAAPDSLESMTIGSIELASWVERHRLGALRLEHARLVGADIEGGDLTFSRLDGANLRGARLDGAAIQYARLSQHPTSLVAASLVNSNLSGVDLRGADLSDATLVSATAFSANLSQARLRHADFTKADLRFALLDRVTASQAVFRQADLRGALISNSNFPSAHMPGARLDTAKISDTRFVSANLAACTLQRADLRSVTLRESMLIGADFREATVVDSSLQNSDMRGCRLDAAEFRNCNLREARLQGSIAFDANLSGVLGLWYNQTTQMIGDSQTKLPQSLAIPQVVSLPGCWDRLPDFPTLPTLIDPPSWWMDDEFHREHLLCRPLGAEFSDNGES